jgi:LAO/AO transport system kinase
MTRAAAILNGDRRALAQAITLIESARDDHAQEAGALLTELMPHAGRSFRLAISGVPGVGKSTFIEAFGQRLLARGHRLAILAIDPSSPLSGGSILGDRTRMEELSRDERVFIRPSPTSGNLGGVARRTREAIVACEAAGFDFIIVETVGVGQSETVAAQLVDAFLLLYLPNAGDELQGIKRGILELADLVAVTKADGPQAPVAQVAKGQLERAFMVAKQAAGQSAPPVLLVSSLENKGLAELETALFGFEKAQKAAGTFAARRQAQSESWLEEELVARFRDLLARRQLEPDALATLAAEVRAGSLPASVAAERYFTRLLSRARSSSSTRPV